MKEKIYFIPGLMTDIRLWKRVFPLLENEFELVHVPIPQTTNFDEMNKTLLEVFKEEKVNILGFSLGGYIASYFAINFPNRVKRIFLAAATASSTPIEEIEKRKEHLKNIEKGRLKLSYKKALSLVEEKNQNDEDLINTIINMFDESGKETFISQLTSTLHREDIFDKLADLDLPIWIFYSKDDRLLNKEALEKMQFLKEKINLILREGTSHNLPLETPNELALYIKNWIVCKKEF